MLSTCHSSKEGKLDIYEEKRFANRFSSNNYHFISYISNDFNNKKIVLNLTVD